MNLFVVFKEGAYRHECGGIFDTFEQAVGVAKQFAEGDRDGYHAYNVVPFVINAVTPQITGEKVLRSINGHPYFAEKGELEEPGDVLFTCCKQVEDDR